MEYDETSYWKGVLHTTRGYWEMLCIPWHVPLISLSSFLIFSRLLSHFLSNKEGNNNMKEEWEGDEEYRGVIIDHLIHYVNENQIQHLLSQLALPYCLHLIHHITQLIFSSNHNNNNNNNKDNKAKKIENNNNVIIALLSLPLSHQTIKEMAQSVIEFARYHKRSLKFSLRKLLRKLVKKLVEYAINNQLVHLYDQLSTLKSLSILRLGSKSDRSLDHFLSSSLINNSDNNNDNDNNDEEKKENKEEKKDEREKKGELSSSSPLVNFIKENIRERKYKALYLLIDIDVSLLISLIDQHACDMEEITFLILYLHSSSFPHNNNEDSQKEDEEMKGKIKKSCEEFIVRDLLLLNTSSQHRKSSDRFYSQYEKVAKNIAKINAHLPSFLHSLLSIPPDNINNNNDNNDDNNEEKNGKRRGENVFFAGLIEFLFEGMKCYLEENEMKQWPHCNSLSFFFDIFTFLFIFTSTPERQEEGNDNDNDNDNDMNNKVVIDNDMKNEMKKKLRSLYNQLIPILYKFYSISCSYPDHMLQTSYLPDDQRKLYYESKNNSYTPSHELTDQDLFNQITEILINLLTTNANNTYSHIIKADNRFSTSFKESFGVHSYFSYINLISIILSYDESAFPSVYPEVFIDQKDLYLETSIHCLGMTLSDPETLINSLQLMPYISFSSPSQLDSVFYIFKSIIEFAYSSEELLRWSVQGVGLALNLLASINKSFASKQRNGSNNNNNNNNINNNYFKDKSKFFWDSEAGEKLYTIHSAIQSSLLSIKNQLSVGIYHSLMTNIHHFHLHSSSPFSSHQTPSHPHSNNDYNNCHLTHHTIEDDWKFIQKGWLNEEVLNQYVGQSYDLFMMLLHYSVPSSSSSPSLSSSLENYIILKQDLICTLIGAVQYFSEAQLIPMIKLLNNFTDETKKDLFSSQLSIIAICKSFSYLPISTITSQLKEVLQAVPLKLKNSLESIHAPSHVIALKSIIHLLQLKFDPIVNNSFLNDLFQYILKSFNQPKKSIQMLEIIQYHLIIASFLLLENYAKESQISNFTKAILDLFLHKIGSSRKTNPFIKQLLFSGLNNLLISFSLSQTHRNHILNFALENLSSNFLISVNLMATCMYTGELPSSKSSLSPSSPSLPSDVSNLIDKSSPSFTPVMDNIERSKVLLGKLKQGSEFEVQAITQILPNSSLISFPLTRSCLYSWANL